MPAPTVATLYDFETAYESALASYFSNANATWQVLTPATLANVALNTGYLRTPRLTVEFTVGGTADKRDIQNTVEYYSERSGTMTIEAAVQRGNAAQSESLVRGTARQAMIERSGAFNSNALPYYQTVDVSETSSSRSVDEANDELITQLTYAIKFWIPPTSFP